MDYILVLALCFGINNTCVDPVKPEVIFNDYYTCITFGYDASKSLLAGMTPPRVNELKAYVKFMCEQEGENT
ncbi:MAG: hypothetical protein ACKVHD_07560 [Alphaproteobacteria bacterium]|jgi:hypothetical protein